MDTWGAANDKGRVRVRFWDQMVLVGMALAVFYTIFDSILYIFLSYDVDFFGRLFGPDISEIWSRLTIMALFLILGSHAQFTINQRKVAEIKLRESEEKYRTIIETTQDGYYEVDTAGVLTFFNDATSNILGYSRHELTGMSERIPLDPESNRKVVRAFNEVYETGEPAKVVEWAFTRRDSTKRFVESSVSLLKNAKGQATGFSGFLRDVTERKQAEALEQDKLAAEAANRAKSDFIAKMSHEIRTPLNSIIGMVELMLDTDLKPRQREDLDVIISASHALLSIINNILDFSRIDAGRLEIEETAFNPREVLGESLRIMAMRCHEKGLELAYRVAPEVPDQLVGDSARFRQVLLNLVDNAYKFTDSGECVVNVTRKVSPEAGAYLQVSVSDTGVGIAEDKQEDIFKAFIQVEAATSRRYGGAGLGLAVSSQLVRMMGGRLWVESEPDQGATIHFTARFGGLEEAASAEIEPPDPVLQDVRVLVVDDSSTSCKFIMEMLESWNMMPRAALGVEEARQILNRSHAGGNPLDIVLIDVSLPDTGGHELARWIKNHDELEPAVVMLLTFPHLHSKVDLRDFGIAASVIKPIRVDDLQSAVLTALGVDKKQLAELPGKAAERVEKATEPLKILVAEDIPFNQKFIIRLLERWGHEVVVAENGRQVLEILPFHPFDLVLMDVQMPEMDGYEATRAIRKTEIGSGAHIPIIAMTAHAIKGDRERCLESGMDEYLSKPISSTRLVEILKGIAGRKTGEKASQAVDKSSLMHQDKTVNFDRQMLKDAFDHDWEFFREIVELFVTDYPQMISDLKSALKGSDSSALRRAAHSLKGMVKLFQAEEAMRMALALEERGKNGDFTGAKEAIEEIDAELAKMEKTLLELAEEKSRK